MKPVYFQGLKKRPLFDEIVGYLETQQQMMKYPDRTATRIKDSHYYTNLDGQGGMSIADQVEKVQKERLMQEMRRQTVENHYIGSDGNRTPPAYTPIGSDRPNLYTPSFMSAREVDSVDWYDLDIKDELQAQVEAKRKKLKETIVESVPTTQAQRILGQSASSSGAVVGQAASSSSASSSGAVVGQAATSSSASSSVPTTQAQRIVGQSASSSGAAVGKAALLDVAQLIKQFDKTKLIKYKTKSIEIKSPK